MGGVRDRSGGARMRRGMIQAPAFMPPMGMRFPGAPPMMPGLPGRMPEMPGISGQAGAPQPNPWPPGATMVQPPAAPYGMPRVPAYMTPSKSAPTVAFPAGYNLVAPEVPPAPVLTPAAAPPPPPPVPSLPGGALAGEGRPLKAGDYRTKGAGIQFSTRN